METMAEAWQLEALSRIIPTRAAIHPLEVMRRFLALGGTLEWDKGPYQWGPYQRMELAESANKLLGNPASVLTTCEDLRLWIETANSKWEAAQTRTAAERWVWQRLEDPIIFNLINTLLARKATPP